MYISLTTWRDLTDGHLYHEGDKFPFDGREIDSKRASELTEGRNRAGLRLIRAVEDAKAQTEARKEEGPEKAPEGRKTARKRKTK